MALPVLARPWVSVSPAARDAPAAWLGPARAAYASALFAKKVQPHPILVTGTVGRLYHGVPHVRGALPSARREGAGARFLRSQGVFEFQTLS